MIVSHQSEILFSLISIISVVLTDFAIPRLSKSLNNKTSASRLKAWFKDPPYSRRTNASCVYVHHKTRNIKRERERKEKKGIKKAPQISRSALIFFSYGDSLPTFYVTFRENSKRMVNKLTGALKQQQTRRQNWLKIALQKEWKIIVQLDPHVFPVQALIT